MSAATLHPKNFFKAFFRPDAGYCFVAMPFAKEFDVVYSSIKSALESPELGFRCFRADEESRAGFIMEDVLRELKDAEVIIADLTGLNANVFMSSVSHIQSRMPDPSC